MVASTLDSIRENDPRVLATKLREALDVAKNMLAECSAGLETAGGSLLERSQEETQRLDGDLEFTKVLVKILGSIADGAIEGCDHDAGERRNVPPSE